MSELELFILLRLIDDILDVRVSQLQPVFNLPLQSLKAILDLQLFLFEGVLYLNLLLLVERCVDALVGTLELLVIANDFLVRVVIGASWFDRLDGKEQLHQACDEQVVG